MKPLRIMVSAAEASGDRLGAALLEALGRRTAVRAMGMGGPAMRAQGFTAWRDASELSMVGLVEVLEHLPRLLRLNCALARRAVVSAPDVAILIDAPDFHLRLARRLRRHGIPVILFVPPAVWASRPGRVQTFGRAFDRILVLFPFEVEAWRGIPTVWVGHPLVDDILGPVRPEAPASAPVALVPGSRLGELRRHLPILAAAARRLVAAGVAARFVAPVATLGLTPAITAGLAGVPLELVHPDEKGSALQSAVGRAKAALVCSGTATLETALLGCPQVAFYRLHAITYAVARRLMTCRHWALPNTLLDRRAIPECIQGRATGDQLAAALEAAIARPSAEWLDVATKLRARLGAGGAADRAADAVLSFVQERGGGRGAGVRPQTRRA